MFSSNASVADSRLEAGHEEPTGWLWETTQLGPGGPCPVSAMRLSDELLLAHSVTDHVSLHRLRAPARHLTLLCSGGAGTLFVAGHRLKPGDCVVSDPSVECEVIAHRHTGVAWLAAADRSCADAMRTLTSRGTSLRPGIHLVSGDARSIAGLHAGVHAALLSWARTADQATACPPRQPLADSLFDRLRHITEEHPRCCAQPRARNRRHAGVEIARQHIRAHLADPISLGDLCSQAHLRPRSLEYGFREILGLSPMSYVKAMRLNVVHRQLLLGSHTKRSISEIALDTGFRHLSQFAVDYKRLFLESPSTTRKRVAKAPARCSAHRSTPASQAGGRRSRAAPLPAPGWG